MKMGKMTIVRASGAATVLVALGILVHKAVASGPTGDPPLIYSGNLTDQGAPANGTYQLAVTLRATADTSSTTNQLCSTGPAGVTVSAGQFQVSLPDACKVALQNNRTAFFEIVVNGTSLGATQLGAVPYAELSVAATRVQRTAPVRYADGGVGTAMTGAPSFCGSTAPTNGSFSATDAAGRAHIGVPAAKELCRSACGGSLSAHQCTKAEFKTFEDQVGYPMSVPTPGWILVDSTELGSVDYVTSAGPCNFVGWDSSGSCNKIYVAPYTTIAPTPAQCGISCCGNPSPVYYTGTDLGFTYGPIGFNNVACDQQLPIHCCD